MKPFTLQWWLLLKDICYSRQINTAQAIGCTQPDSEVRNLLYGEHLRYHRLNKFITIRIINKYGEHIEYADGL